MLLGGGLLLDARFGWHIGFRWYWFAPGAPVALVSGIMLGTAIVQFRHFSRLLPVSALPPDRLIQAGLYGVWRHPIYLFFTLFFAGVGLLIGSPSLLVIVMPAFIAAEAGYIALEERALGRRFGLTWRNYRRRTPLLVPQLGFILLPAFRVVCRLLFGFRVRGNENLPAEPPFFVIAAHRNYIDPFFVGSAVGFPVHFITTFEMFRKPLVGALFRLFLCIPKRRYVNDISAARAIAARLKEGAVIGVFPEGERSWTGRTRSWKPEVLNLFRHYSRVPIVPVRISGNYLAWPRWGPRLRRAQVELAIGAPVLIRSGATDAEIERQLRALIEPNDSGRGCASPGRNRDITMVLYRCPSCLSRQRLTLEGRSALLCRDCGQSFEVMPDYSIAWRQDGTRFELALPAAYERIRIKVDDLAGKDGIVATSDAAQLWEESGIELKPVTAGRLTLGRRVLRIDGPAGARVIDLAPVRSVTTEGNCRLQLYDTAAGRLHQLTFPDESVLKWQDLIVAVLRKEFGVEPNTR